MSSLSSVEESLNHLSTKPGSLVSALVRSINERTVVLDARLKSESVVPIEQFMNAEGQLDIEVGQHVDVILEHYDQGDGETILSREKAKRYQAWIEIGHALEQKTPIPGHVHDRLKGGFMVILNVNGTEIRSFLPGSLSGFRPQPDMEEIKQPGMTFRVVKCDPQKNNVVVSRKAILEDNNQDRKILIDSLKEGSIVKGIVKNMTDYGVFIDIGGVDGLLHITDISWRRIKHPSDALSINQEIQACVLKIDQARGRISLGVKQLNKSPWETIQDRYVKGQCLKGKVTNIMDYGCFVELEEGLEGLVHVSEMDWANKNVHPGKLVQLGAVVDVMILEVDVARKRVSLGMKQCKPNPWVEFEKNHKKGDVIRSHVRSVTDFGLFVALDAGVDGLVHLSDISWSENWDPSVRQQYKKGMEIEAMILAVDIERERISLGIKQLQTEICSEYLEQHPMGSIITTTIKEVQPRKLILHLTSELSGFIYTSEAAKEKLKDLRNHFSVGATIDAKIIGVDRKQRAILMSIRALSATEDEEVQHASRQPEHEIKQTTIGDLLVQRLEKQQQNEEHH